MATDFVFCVPIYGHKHYQMPIIVFVGSVPKKPVYWRLSRPILTIAGLPSINMTGGHAPKCSLFLHQPAFQRSLPLDGIYFTTRLLRPPIRLYLHQPHWKYATRWYWYPLLVATNRRRSDHFPGILQTALSHVMKPFSERCHLFTSHSVKWFSCYTAILSSSGYHYTIAVWFNPSGDATANYPLHCGYATKRSHLLIRIPAYNSWQDSIYFCYFQFYSSYYTWFTPETVVVHNDVVSYVSSNAASSLVSLLLHPCHNFQISSHQSFSLAVLNSSQGVHRPKARRACVSRRLWPYT
jgi:hypothetical protein